MVESIYDEILALPRGDSRRTEIATAFGCHHLATVMLRILKTEDPDEKARATAKVREILEHKPQRYRTVR